jgi:hypothetical protein
MEEKLNVNISQELCRELGLYCPSCEKTGRCGNTSMMIDPEDFKIQDDTRAFDAVNINLNAEHNKDKIHSLEDKHRFLLSYVTNRIKQRFPKDHPKIVALIIKTVYDHLKPRITFP